MIYLKKFVLGILITCPAIAIANTNNIPNPQTLSGDEADACSAILCLSSTTGRSVSECQNPLKRYFSIKGKKPHETISKRKSFLALCPTGEFSNKDEFLDDLANGSGYCGAAELNISQRESRVIQECKNVRGEQICTPITQWRINNKLPSHCQALFDNGYTDFKNIRYQGTPQWQSQPDFGNRPSGKWVE
ncbi:hypothetical protein BUE93_22055 [Chromobacterium amazonense]|uniref:Conjugal transfer protein TrbM n=1 Tax=Chromobacterium amazonense TaxID=1382803 RepID=A0A2S9WYE6_9NEIS|nr:TrbM/KikA/MpfK family conjugal transfer protein [Chromobacterium amazonense]PRP68488.1 hypothetical protein BUE93_22055 [Chromobacterium amazonense]